MKGHDRLRGGGGPKKLRGERQEKERSRKIISYIYKLYL